MLVDARDLQPGTTLRADVAIVGAGAVGLLLAHELVQRKHTVLLLESGGFEYDARTQQLYDGPAVGEVLTPESYYLASTRLRYFGGSTNHWGGWCRPLDAVDFEQRDWIPHSGWPFGLDEVAPYYRRAEALLDVPSFATEDEQLEGAPRLMQESERVTTKLFHIRKRQFRLTLGPEVRAAATVVSHANLVDVTLDPDGRRVERLELASWRQRPLHVEAGTYVLAMGGIENARMLLASRAVHADGIGNGNDLVGRYFMEHPHALVGEIFLTRTPRSRRLYLHRTGPRDRRLGILCLSEDERRRRRLPHASLNIVPSEATEAAPGEALWEAAEDVDRLRIPHSAPRQGTLGGLYARWEQVPDPASRLVLDEARDELGIPRARLEWRLSDVDFETIRQTGETMAQELGRSGEGRIALHFDPEDPWKGVTWGNHHLGTTRMSATASDGVVDADSRVHDLDNLWIGGSSVFPTGGFSNPTLTILALTYRLADRLDRELGG